MPRVAVARCPDCPSTASELSRVVGVPSVRPLDTGQVRTSLPGATPRNLMVEREARDLLGGAGMNRILAVTFVSALVLGCGATAQGPLAPKNPTSPVIVYTAQNCGEGCWAMLNHLRSRGVAHLERDVDRMPGAR